MSSRLRRPAGALLATAVATSVFGIIPAAHAADGTVTGTVTETGSGGAALEDIDVQAWEFRSGYWTYSEATGASATTDALGGYTLELPPGNYRIAFDDYTSGDHISEFYNNAPDVDSANTIAVADGAATPNINADLAVASHITGSVAGPDGLPLEDGGVGVAAYQLVTDDGFSYWNTVGYAFTDALGDYNLGGLPAGSYRVGFEDQTGGGLAEEFYDDQASQNTAEDIAVPALTTVPGIDAQLDPASQITGTVTDAANSALAGVEVYAYVNDGSDWDYTSRTADTVTDANGHYTLDGLAKGAYRVEFEFMAGDDFLYEVWNNKGRIEDGDDIVVGTDVTVAGKDAQLVDGEHDPIPFTMTSAPTVSGTTQVGSTLTATGGSWVPTPASTDFYWFSGEDYTGVSGPTYNLTAADLGKTFSVLVQVWGPEGQYDFANTGNIGPITAVPVVAPPVVTPAPVPAPAPAPVISFSKKIDVVGALTVGSTLKLKNFKALVSRAVVTYKIQWYAGSKKIKKATKSKLKVTQALKGKKIKVKVSATSGTTTKTVTVKVGKIR